jgi:ribosomal protein RSM22 (predicted rRNA methylase)
MNLLLTAESKRILNSVPTLIEKTFPIPGRFRNALPKNIAELSRLLTNRRGERSLSYLNRPNFLSAYLYYFLPWNLYRLCILLPTLNISLSKDNTITDLGCGPLTFASALWITYPKLRNTPLKINCIDRSGPALEAGMKFFSALCAKTSGNADTPWKINPIKEDIDIRRSRKGGSSLVCAVNMFNEIYESIPHSNTEKLQGITANIARILYEYGSKDSCILTVEPGVPQSGKFISLLRNELYKLNHSPIAPCTHTASCPFAGRTSKLLKGRNLLDTKKRWCHFAFENFDVSKELHQISKAAKLPKERLTLSYLLAGGKKEKIGGARIISDAFPLPENKFGRYGCSEQGLILVTGERNRIEELSSLSFVPQNKLIDFYSDKQYDLKSGALKKRY